MLQGESKSIRWQLMKCLEQEQVIQWQGSANCTSQIQSQLAPLNDYLQSTKVLDSVTVIIPTHRQIPKGLTAFTKQCAHVWILQNGSLQLPNVPNTKIFQVPFLGHGQIRQHMISQIETPFVFFSVDDAIPMGNMLALLVAQMDADSNEQKWDALIARQIPYPIADRFTQDQLALWTPFAKQPYPVLQSDHVGTLYRVADLRNAPLPNVPTAEDAWWSLGKKVGCVPQAVIVHSHPRHSKELVLREWSIHQELSKMGRDCGIDLKAVAMGLIANTQKYGLREGLRSTVQNVARFAAHKVPRQPKP